VRRNTPVEALRVVLGFHNSTSMKINVGIGLLVAYFSCSWSTIQLRSRQAHPDRATPEPHRPALAAPYALGQQQASYAGIAAGPMIGPLASAVVSRDDFIDGGSMG
jgi:hypothetical protein